MVDNRSSGYFGIGGGFNFKSGDISGTAAKTSDEKMGQGGEYFQQGRRDDDDQNWRSSFYVDRSAQLNASLNSLAMINVVNVLKNQKRLKIDKDGRLRGFGARNEHERIEAIGERSRDEKQDEPSEQ